MLIQLLILSRRIALSRARTSNGEREYEARRRRRRSEAVLLLLTPHMNALAHALGQQPPPVGRRWHVSVAPLGIGHSRGIDALAR